MLPDPSSKYSGYQRIHLPHRQWSHRIIRQAPMWLSTDLRDGNQALQTPMTVEQKLAFFAQLVRCGFKEIEIGFPSASQTEFAFVRQLIEGQHIPEDVWIQVMTPCRKDLIDRTFEAIRGSKRVIIHLYSATGTLFRDIVYRYSKARVLELAAEHTAYVRGQAIALQVQANSAVRLCYGVEGFSQTEPQFAVEVCARIKQEWEADSRTIRPCIFNLASTVESGPANHFADQVEYFCQNIPDRDHVIVGVHPHNDRGTGVAAAELALLAGAQRIDVCLLGNGERSGNVDGIILALNLYSQGISPGLDFGHLDEITELVTSIIKIPVHPRHPYVGSLVYTAFSGAHQDGIAKGFLLAKQRRSTVHNSDAVNLSNAQKWIMPYLPVDPTDFGFAYQPIRVNSQSGKSGVAHIIRNSLGFELPKGLQLEFQRIIQKLCEAEAREASVEEVLNIFRGTYKLEVPPPDSHSSIQASAWELDAFPPTPAHSPEGHSSPTTIYGDTASFVRENAPQMVTSEVQTLNSLGVEVSYTLLACGEVSKWGIGQAESKLESAERSIICALERLQGKGSGNEVERNI